MYTVILIIDNKWAISYNKDTFSGQGALLMSNSRPAVRVREPGLPGWTGEIPVPTV